MLIRSLTGSHDRKGFDCGRAELNDWLRNVARQHQDKGLSRTFVAALQQQQPQQILGYYALAMTEVDTGSLSEHRRRKLPRLVPGVRLGRLAVARNVQGKRLGELLLMDAITRVRRIADQAGVVGLFVDAIDEVAVTFYQRYGLEAFLDEPLKLFLPVR